MVTMVMSVRVCVCVFPQYADRQISSPTLRLSSVVNDRKPVLSILASSAVASRWLQIAGFTFSPIDGLRSIGECPSGAQQASLHACLTRPEPPATA